MNPTLAAMAVGLCSLVPLAAAPAQTKADADVTELRREIARVKEQIAALTDHMKKLEVRLRQAEARQAPAPGGTAPRKLLFPVDIERAMMGEAEAGARPVSPRRGDSFEVVPQQQSPAVPRR
jgi:hypothetical protein